MLSFLRRLADGLAALSGWRRALTALTLGVLATLALPPFGVVPALLVAATGVTWLLLGATTPRAAAWIGWWFGLGHLTTGLYWIANALLIDAASFWWMVPFAMLALPAFLALFIAAATWGAWESVRGWHPERRPLLLPLALAATWALSDYARGHILTGFPWNLPGYIWGDTLPMLQGAAWFGIYGLSLITLLLATAPAALIARRGGWLVGGLAVAGIILASAGWLRLSDHPRSDVAGVTLRLVQPNIPQSLKWSPAERAGNFRKHLELSTRPSDRPLTAIIWPESATAFSLEATRDARAMVADIAPAGGVVISGTPRFTRDAADKLEVWNGMVALDGDGSLRAAYDKFHLVPFGEYVPGRGILPIERVVPGGLDYSPGPGPRTIRLPGLPPVGPLICYEVIFPGAVIDPTDRPSWLLNLTNDAWYGYSTGPFQHFIISAVRAVEEGVPLVRVASTGISGIVDPLGRVTARLGLEQEGVLDADLPQALTEAPLYARWRDAPMLITAMLILAALGWRRSS